MQTPLSHDEVVGRIENAFSPFECTVKFRDHFTMLSFQVIGADGGPLIRVQEIPMSVLRAPQRLDSIVSQAITFLPPSTLAGSMVGAYV